MVRKLLWLVVCCFLIQPTWAQVIGNDRVSSTVSHQSIGLDETATLTISVKGVNDVMDAGTPTVRPSSGLQVVPVGRQFSMSTINGRSETVTRFNFLLTPLEKGRYIIDPVTIVVNGVSHQTTSHRLEVTDALGRGRPQQSYPGSAQNPWNVAPGSPLFRIPSDPVTPLRRPRGEDYLLEADLDPLTVYKHEPAIYNLRLLTAVRLMRDPRYSPILPTGLISVSFPQENSQEYRDGRAYSVTEAKTAFFPLTEGEYEFPASEVAMNTGIFNSNTEILKTDPKTLKVLPLPTEDRPESFTGAVGEDFEISASVDKSMVKAGETVELKIEAYGEGNLDLVPYPYLPNWQGVEKKQADGTSAVNARDGRVTSSRTYVFRIKMTKPGSYNLDNIALAYFRPSVERYEVLKAPSVSVEVLPGEPASANLQEGSTGSTSLPEQDAPQILPGPTVRTAGRVGLSQLAALVGLALLGLVMGFAQPSLKSPSFRFGGLYSKPKDLASLDKAMTEIAPGADRLVREEQLSELGWSPSDVADFESLKSRLASKRYGSHDDQTGVDDLLDSYQALIKRMKT